LLSLFYCIVGYWLVVGSSSNNCNCVNKYSTCCKLVNNTFGCCPYTSAICCDDKLHCCPRGFKCDNRLQTCVSGSNESIMRTKIRVEEVIKDKDHCPVGTCFTFETCCMLDDSTWGCCAYKNATCCSDHIHCCPEGFKCDIINKDCMKSNSDRKKILIKYEEKKRFL